MKQLASQKQEERLWHSHFIKTLLSITSTMDVPTNVAVQYNQRFSQTPENMAAVLHDPNTTKDPGIVNPCSLRLRPIQPVYLRLEEVRF